MILQQILRFIGNSFLSRTGNLLDLIFDNSHIEPIGKMYHHTLNTEEVVCLQEMYHKIFENSGITLASDISCLSSLIVLN